MLYNWGLEIVYTRAYATLISSPRSCCFSRRSYFLVPLENSIYAIVALLRCILCLRSRYTLLTTIAGVRASRLTSSSQLTQSHLRPSCWARLRYHSIPCLARHWDGGAWQKNFVQPRCGLGCPLISSIWALSSFDLLHVRAALSQLIPGLSCTPTLVPAPCATVAIVARRVFVPPL